MLIPKRYFDVLEEKGQSLREIGSSEIALARSAALEAIHSLKGSEAAILGGNVVRVFNRRPEYGVESWYAQQQPAEPLFDYLKRSLETAENYIRAFPDPEDGTVLYTLVVSELGLS